MPIQAITFDAGGTLLYPHPSVGEIYADVMARHGLRHDPARLQDAFTDAWSRAQRSEDDHSVSENSEWHFWRRLVSEVLVELGQPDDFDAMFEDLWYSFGDHGHWRLHDGARELLNSLRAANYRLAILSNWDSRLRTILEGMELDSIFDAIVISSEIGHEKPATEIFRYTERALDLPPESILHVGDSVLHDIEGAQAAGWKAVYINHNGKHQPDLTVIGHLAELVGVLA